MKADPQTINVYDQKAGEYARHFDQDRPSPDLKRFMAALPEAGAVLDFGCGTGRAAGFLQDSGFLVTATDASLAMVKMAQDRYGVAARQATFEELDALDQFDGIWASFSLLHAPRQSMPNHLAALKNAIKPGGILMIGMKTGSGERRDKIGRLYTFYEVPELKGLLDDAGFTVSDERTGEEPGLDGTVSPFVILFARG